MKFCNWRSDRRIEWAKCVLLIAASFFIAAFDVLAEASNKQTADATSVLKFEVQFEDDFVERNQKINELRRSALRKYFSKKSESAMPELTVLAEAYERELVNPTSARRGSAALHYDLVILYGRLGKLQRRAGKKDEADAALRLARIHSSEAFTNGRMEVAQILILIDEIDEKERRQYLAS